MVCPCELLEEKQWVFKKRVPDKAFKWLSPLAQASLFIATLIKQDEKTLLKSISFWVSDTKCKSTSLGKGIFMKTFSAWLVFWWNRPDVPFLAASAFRLFAHEIDLKPWYHHRVTSAFSFLAIFHPWPKNVKILILILGKAAHWTARQKKIGEILPTIIFDAQSP